MSSLSFQEEPTYIQIFTTQPSEIQQEDVLLNSYNLVALEKAEVNVIPVIELRLRFPYIDRDIPKKIEELISFARTRLSISCDYYNS